MKATVVMNKVVGGVVFLNSETPAERKQLRRLLAMMTEIAKNKRSKRNIHVVIQGFKKSIGQVKFVKGKRRIRGKA